MKANDIIKTFMSEKGITQGELTKMLNMKNQSSISGVLNRDMRVSTLVRFLSVLGGELIIKHDDQEYKVDDGTIASNPIRGVGKTDTVGGQQKTQVFTEDGKIKLT